MAGSSARGLQPVDLCTRAQVQKIAVTPDGQRLFCSDSAGRIRLIEIGGMVGPDDPSSVFVKPLREGIFIDIVQFSSQRHYPKSPAYALSPDGKFFAHFYSGVRSGIRVGSLFSDRVVAMLQSNSWCWHHPDIMQFSPDSQNFAVTNLPDGLQVFSIAGNLVNTISTERRRILALAINPDNKTVAVNVNGQITIYSILGSQIPLQSFDCATAGSANISSDRYEHLPENGFASLTYSPDGKLLASGMNDGSLRIWKLKSPEPTVSTTHSLPLIQGPVLAHEFRMPGGRVSALAFANSGKTLAIAHSLKGLYFWQMGATGSPRPITLSLHRNVRAYSLTASHNGKVLIVGCDDGLLKFVSTESGKELATLYLFDGREWFARDSKGNFDCSRFGKTLMTHRKRNRATNFSEANDGHRKPGLLAALLTSNH